MKGFFIQLFFAFSHLLRQINSKIWSLKLKQKDYIKVIKGKKFYFTRYGEIAKILYSVQHLVGFDKGFEYTTLSLYSKVLFKGANVLDIGANVGLFSILGSEIIGSEGKILAFEPSKKTYDALVENLKLNNCTNVETFPLALSDREGTVALTKPNNTEDAFNHMNFDASGTPIENGNDMATMKRLDVLLQEKGITRIDVIKIDVEGAEFLSLKGGDSFFRNTTNLPIIIMECYEPWCKRFNTSVYEVLSYLAQLGYSFEQYENWQWIAIPSKQK